MNETKPEVRGSASETMRCLKTNGVAVSSISHRRPSSEISSSS